MTADSKRILINQALRGFAYGFGAVLLGASLQARGWSSVQVGFLLTTIIAGIAVMSIVVGTMGDRIGRRRLYAALFLLMAAAGTVFALTSQIWLLLLAALTGTLSTDVVEAGPLSSLEVVMLPTGLTGNARTRIFGTYNTVAVLAGSTGALLAGGPALLRRVWPGVPADQRFFLVFLVVGLAGAWLATSLSERVEVKVARSGRPLGRSRPAVLRLAALFSVDAFAGGFIVQSFIAYWFRLRFGVPLETLGLIFFLVGLLQAASFAAATRLAGRIGLLNTMVFTHLPSNLLLAAIPLAPTFPLALALLFARFALSQMDVPTRQAYVLALVDPEERTAAIAFTNTARYVVRPLAPVLAGVAQQVSLGLPFVLAGTIKAGYDLVIWGSFRRRAIVPTEAETRQEGKRWPPPQ
ncbi:MAG: MFS transporter [Chloroflexi bacterium]|nr:MAG: MFS transporter [Chloroflexota bacterium]